MREDKAFLLYDGICMVEGFKYDNIIKIGFLNQYDENQLKHYKENFDVVILNDLDMFFVNNLVREF